MQRHRNLRGWRMQKPRVSDIGFGSLWVARILPEILRGDNAQRARG